MAFACHGVWAVALDSLRRLFRPPMARRVLEGATGVALIGLAVRVLTAGNRASQESARSVTMASTDNARRVGIHAAIKAAAPRATAARTSVTGSPGEISIELLIDHFGSANDAGDAERQAARDQHRGLPQNQPHDRLARVAPSATRTPTSRARRCTV